MLKCTVDIFSLAVDTSSKQSGHRVIALHMSTEQPTSKRYWIKLKHVRY